MNHAAKNAINKKYNELHHKIYLRIEFLSVRIRARSAEKTAANFARVVEMYKTFDGLQKEMDEIEKARSAELLAYGLAQQPNQNLREKARNIKRMAKNEIH